MIQVNRVINASQIKVWEILIDTQLWPVWGPSIIKVDSPSRYLRAGLRGRVKTAAHIWLNFAISEFMPLQYWHWKIAGIPATGHRVRQLGENRCELVFELPLFAFPYALICQKALNRIGRLAIDEGEDWQTSEQGIERGPEQRERKPDALWRSAPDHWKEEIGKIDRREQ
jgi:hypothetical protein